MGAGVHVPDGACSQRMKAPVNTNIPMPDNNNKASGAMSPDGGGSEKKSKKKGGDAVQA